MEDEKGYDCCHFYRYDQFRNWNCRISGEEAFAIIDRIYKGKEQLSQAESHTIHYGFIKDREETIDEVLVSVMRAPRTFTGEDTVEINCHGGTFVVRKVLETVIKNGARPAEPGEFTKRAFLNGKMDLSQAEAVIDVITSQNEYALKSSMSQLKGSVKRKIEEMRKEILYHTALLKQRWMIRSTSVWMDMERRCRQ